MKRTLPILVVLLIAAQTSTASAGGLYLTDRGTRPMGRGGAFVAGADDPSALWYNPAGLAYSGNQLMVDATYNFLSADFTRIDGGGNVLPTVSASTAPLPIPGIMYTNQFGLRDWTFGLGVWAPNALLLNWPQSIDVNGTPGPAPQRYSLLSMDGSLLSHIGIGAAWRANSRFSIGATFQMIVGSFQARTTLSACDRALCTQPENPEYDSVAEVRLSGIAQPTASFGAIYDLDIVRFGASFILGYPLSGEGEIRTRLPSASPFDSASVDGNRGSVHLDFPMILRLGAEFRPIRDLRVELALVYEGWSTQDALTITPHDVYLRNVQVVGDYQVGPISIPRNMKDVFSVRLGGEYHTGMLGLRAGVSYENGAFDDAHLTPLTLDSDKFIASLGASVEVAPGVFIDAVVFHTFMRNRQVRDSAVPQSNPIRPPPSDPVYVGNGDYTMEATTVGLGLRWQFARPIARTTPDPDARASGQVNTGT
ncbi:MAG: outer membrane protein transport protein [Sandaracinaceae bacterium]|nr:outer membrane protein transport protein [Sandaracinaceae bacterium]